MHGLHSWSNMSVPPWDLIPFRTCSHYTGRKKEMWPQLLKFMQCALMMLWCIHVLCYAKCRVATLLIALHKLQHLTGPALPFTLARSAMWAAGDKLECVQSVQQIKWLHMFFCEGSGVDIIKSEKPPVCMSYFAPHPKVHPLLLSLERM